MERGRTEKGIEMNQRENFFAMLEGKAEFSPIYNSLYKICSIVPSVIERPADGKKGMDAYGGYWNRTVDGFLPDPGKYLFEEISDWKDRVKIPDLDNYNMEMLAAQELDEKDRKEKIINIMWNTGLFDRLVAFMGFENALIALAEEPESCEEYFGVMADFKIETVNRMIEAYRPDAITYCDDLAAAQNLFMSPSAYRTIIKPHHKRIIEAIVSKGVICIQHTCGKCEDILDDYVEMGVQVWSSAQHMNDLPGIQKRYGHKLLIEGGFNSSGRAGCIDAAIEEILSEAQRCLDMYAGWGILFYIPVS